MSRAGLERFLNVNKQLLFIFFIVLISALVNYLFIQNRSFINFYFLPVIFASYVFGKREGTLASILCFLVVVALLMSNPSLLVDNPKFVGGKLERWLDIITWGCFLVLTGYLMGLLHEAKEKHVQELKRTHQGVLMILSHFIAQDKYTQGHSHRVSIYATKIGQEMGLPQHRIEDVRAAAMLHDLGKVEVNREILYKAAQLSKKEFEEMKTHVEKGYQLMQPVGGSLKRILPIVLSHHDKFDGSGYHDRKGAQIPLEARIIAVADAYDALISDRPYRKALSTFEAKESIIKGAGGDFDPQVVAAFAQTFRKGLLEVPETMI